MTDMIPAPGSPDAVAKGCKCPVLDNARGTGIQTHHGKEWWVSGDCPLHGVDAPKGEW